MTTTFDDVGPDVEGAVMRYLRQSTVMLASPAEARTYLAVKQPAFPYVRVMRIGGGEDASDVPWDNGLLQIDVFGAVEGLLDAGEVRRAVRIALACLEETPYTDAGNCILVGANVRDERRFPTPDAQDPDGKIGERPRYIITAEVSAVGLVPVP